MRGVRFVIFRFSMLLLPVFTPRDYICVFDEMVQRRGRKDTYRCSQLVRKAKERRGEKGEKTDIKWL